MEVQIEEHDRIVLTDSLPDEGLTAGDVGTVVHIYDKGAAYEVEFFTLGGRTVTVVTIPSSLARPVSEHEITHARSLV